MAHLPTSKSPNVSNRGGEQDRMSNLKGSFPDLAIAKGELEVLLVEKADATHSGDWISTRDPWNGAKHRVTNITWSNVLLADVNALCCFLFLLIEKESILLDVLGQFCNVVSA